MDNYKDIDKTRYVISRVFSESETAAKLIEQRIIKEKSHIPPLTGDGGMLYNKFGGSVQSKEVL